jgi:uncharacterized protein (DUF2267 family)
MKETGGPPTIRSVLVALDDACSDYETMETAAQLAADLHAELQGLYVEDVNVLRMAALPFTEEITAASGIARPIDAESMERAMRNKAEHVRRLMERTAARVRIRCSFSVARGHVTQSALLATSEADLVLFGSRSHAPAMRPPIGTRTRSAVRPIVAVVDAAAMSARTLDTAAAVGQRQGRGLVVLICDNEHDDVVEQLAGRVRDELAARGVDANVPPGPIRTVAALIQSARAHRAAMVLLSRACRLLDEVAVRTLLENLDCSIVLV